MRRRDLKGAVAGLLPRNRPRRAAIVLRLPRPLLEMPLEAFIAFYGVVAAGLVIFASAIPATMLALLPFPLIIAWAVCLALGAITTGLGMQRKYRALIPPGLRLFALMLVVYMGAAIYMVGVGALAVSLFILPLASLAGLRSFYLRATQDVAEVVARTEAERRST